MAVMAAPGPPDFCVLIQTLNKILIQILIQRSGLKHKKYGGPGATTLP